jgi:hypothetical protein
VKISDPLVANLPSDHDKGGRIIVDTYLQVDGFAIADCASIIDLHREATSSDFTSRNKGGKGSSK